jgi:hypothetical protein
MNWKTIALCTICAWAGMLISMACNPGESGSGPTASAQDYNGGYVAVAYVRDDCPPGWFWIGNHTIDSLTHHACVYGDYDPNDYYGDDDSAQ